MSKRKGKSRSKDPLSALIAEAKAFERQRVGSAKTLSEARKARERKKANRLLFQSVLSPDARFRTMEGAMVRDHIRAKIVTDICTRCGTETERVGELEIWSKAELRGSTFWQLAVTIRNRTLYEMNSSLPLRIVELNNFVPSCPDCIRKDAEKRKEKQNERNA